MTKGAKNTKYAYCFIVSIYNLNTYQWIENCYFLCSSTYDFYNKQLYVEYIQWIETKNLRYKTDRKRVKK